jgi:16S rRNA (guanine527-N7)-methyltransferase
MPRISTPEAFAEAFDVSRETLDRLTAYEALLKRWQKAVNLVAPSTLGDIWHRHFADSAQLLRHAPRHAKTWLDVGSGAGFPGLVLALLLAERGEFSMMLVESDTRKAAFLREVARVTGVPVEICAGRIEKIATHTKVAPLDVVTARAVAPLYRLLRLVAPVLSRATTALFLKGRDAAAEVEEARKHWSFKATLAPSLTDPEGRIVVITDFEVLTER